MEEPERKAGGRWGKVAPFLIVVSALAIAFEGGLLYRTGAQSPEPLVIRIPEYRPELAPPGGGGTPPGLENVSVTVPAAPAPSAAKAEECRFVGSRNSDKYHLPECAPAKRIKPENLRCFATEAEAQAAGYVAGCLN